MRYLTQVQETYRLSNEKEVESFRMIIDLLLKSIHL